MFAYNHFFLLNLCILIYFCTVAGTDNQLMSQHFHRSLNGWRLALVTLLNDILVLNLLDSIFQTPLLMIYRFLWSLVSRLDDLCPQL